MALLEKTSETILW